MQYKEKRIKQDKYMFIKGIHHQEYVTILNFIQKHIEIYQYISIFKCLYKIYIFLKFVGFGNYILAVVLVALQNHKLVTYNIYTRL